MDMGGFKECLEILDFLLLDRIGTLGKHGSAHALSPFYDSCDFFFRDLVAFQGPVNISSADSNSSEMTSSAPRSRRCWAFLTCRVLARIWT